ncbi:hypothetical protein [Pedobacter sp. Leaf216]|uniref:hypothetical protein n=1 Tax=Pedobacter sp. Leaf216 TaxID=1735684 RepID=UPI0012FAE5F4|nr:hypothetical protein [Pedobacter sp. Leaf216]
MKPTNTSSLTLNAKYANSIMVPIAAESTAIHLPVSISKGRFISLFSIFKSALSFKVNS